MTISDELREYVNRWECRTGCRPGAMPVTEKEWAQLRDEFSDVCFWRPAPPDGISTFLGIDVYFTPDAKERRAQIVEMK